MSETKLVLAVSHELIQLASDWHNGQSSMLYAISSSKGLYRGSCIPLNCDNDEQWDLYLLQRLDFELRQCLTLANEREKKKLASFQSLVAERMRELQGDKQIQIPDDSEDLNEGPMIGLNND